MRIKLQDLLLVILLIALTAIVMVGISGCSDAKLAQQGYKKFIKHGGKIDCKNDTIWKKDTTYVDGKIIIDSFPIPCNCPTLELPKTKYQIRYEWKTKRDSIDVIKYKIKYEYKTIIKYKKIEEKAKFSWTWFLIALSSWIITAFLIFKKFISK